MLPQLTKESKRYQDKYEKILDEKEKLMSANYELKTTLDREQHAHERKYAMLAEKDQEIAQLTKKIQQLEAAAKKK